MLGAATLEDATLLVVLPELTLTELELVEGALDDTSAGAVAVAGAETEVEAEDDVVDAATVVA